MIIHSYMRIVGEYVTRPPKKDIHSHSMWSAVASLLHIYYT